MACVETACHKRQNISSNTVLNMFLWLVLNHKNFEHHHMHDYAKKLAKTETVKNVQLLLNIFFMLKPMCGCFCKHFMFFKERAAASESKCATASESKCAAAS